MDIKHCPKCDLDKLVTDFAPSTHWPDGHYPYCRSCRKIARRENYLANKGQQNADSRQWRAENPEAIKLYNRAATCRRYGLTLESYDALLKLQQCRCPICNATEPGGNGEWHIDHNHETNQVRGLLCSECNLGLGKFKDSVDLLHNAICYLRERDQSLAQVE